MNINDLCSELEVDPSCGLIDEIHRSKIEQWCRSNISTDIQFIGSDEESFRSYLNLAQFYLETFLPNPNIYVAASRGFDKFMASVSRSKINEVNENGSTALNFAVLAGNVATTKILLSLGADPHRPNQQRQLPINSVLLMPIFCQPDLRNKKIEIYRLLAESAPDTLNALDISGDTVLHRIAAQGFFELINETLDVKPQLLSIANNHNHYPIHLAIMNQRKECAEILLRYPGVELQMDANQRTPLEYAFRVNDPDLIEMCLNALADINRRNALGESPLLLAASTGNLPVFLELIDRGADIQALDIIGNSVLHHAVLSGNIDMVRLLLTRFQLDKNKLNLNNKAPIELCEDRDDIRQLFVNDPATGNIQNSQF